MDSHEHYMRKADFLTEMAYVCSLETFSMIIGGDFNSMRRPEDKNNDNSNPQWPHLFNAIIDTPNLREVDMIGRQYTWANKLDPPTFEKLDRVLISTEWESKYPKVKVEALDRSRSDHTPLLLSTRASTQLGTQPLFQI